jgi:hypothetical protein
MLRTLVVGGCAIAAVIGVARLGWFMWNCWPMIRQNFPWLYEDGSSS